VKIENTSESEYFVYLSSTRSVLLHVSARTFAKIGKVKEDKRAENFSNCEVNFVLEEEQDLHQEVLEPSSG
jgi:hypothetical protein